MKEHNPGYTSVKILSFGICVSVFKWIVLLAAYLYLIIVLLRFDKYDELLIHFKKMEWPQAISLFAVFLLLPLNRYLHFLLMCECIFLFPFSLPGLS